MLVCYPPYLLKIGHGGKKVKKETKKEKKKEREKDKERNGVPRTAVLVYPLKADIWIF